MIARLVALTARLRNLDYKITQRGGVISSLEQIVRPFQRTGISYPTRIYDPTAKETKDAVLMLGKEGSTKTLNESFSQRVTTYKDREIKEKSRVTEVKRVENPDDESQYVDVEIIKKLTTEQGEGSRYQKSTYTFENKKA